jgi:hypothetical protein
MKQPLAVKGKGAIFGTASLVFALLTVVLPVIVMIYFGSKAANALPPENNNRAKDIGEAGAGLVPFAIALAGVGVAIVVSGVSSLVGTLTGVVAMIRREPKRWFAVIGLIVNVPVTVSVLFLILAVWANNGGQ